MSDLSKQGSELPAEQRAIRAKCFHPSGTFVEFKKEEIEQSIPRRFEKMVQVYSERIAIKTQHDTLTYGELNSAADRLAGALLARRGFANEPVALFIADGSALIVGILGILKAGKIFVVIDPSFPEERINFLLEDSQARLLVTNGSSLQRVRSYVQDGVELVNLDELNADFRRDEIHLRLSSDSIATLVYTSGSTGRPKGVIQNHRNILHTILRDTQAVNISPHDRLALLRSTSTSGAVADLFDGLLNGAAVYPYNILKEGFVRLGAWLIQEEITIFNSVSSTFRHFLGMLAEEHFPQLRLIYVGGEPVFRDDVDLYKEHFAERCILAVRMGCGEAGKVCHYLIDKNLEIRGNDVPVGYAHEDLKILLFDDTGKQIGFGAVGEIAIRSRYLSPGYWRMPEITKARFLSDPAPGDERIYLSGDLGLMTSDGCLFHLGRKDFQVKIRGYQVEVVEIERLLLQHDGIKEAVVVCREDHSSELVAYWVPNKWPGPTVSELRRYLRKNLPDYMIPSIFMVLKVMPVMPTGKLDRHALPTPDNSRPELDNVYVAPTNSIEEELARIWGDVLGVNQVGIHDTFFDLGGHSLRATQIISRIIMTLKVELPIKFFLNSPTVAEMAASITDHGEKKLGEKELKGILTELESLAEEEAQRLLTVESDKQKLKS